MDLSFITTTLGTVADIVNKVRNVTNYYTNKSISDVAKLTRVEPLTIVSKDCLNLDYMPDVMNSLLSIFSGYYLQAVSILSTVNEVEFIKLLDSLNPDRDETGFLLANESIDSFKYNLLPNKVSLEAVEDKVLELNTKTLAEVTNLSVGKLLHIYLDNNRNCNDENDCSIDNNKNNKKGNSKITIPVNVRLIASVIPNASIVKLLASKAEDNSLVERYHAWRSGRITFIRDLIFCQDLIDEHKKAILTDDSGTMSEITRRVANAKKYGVLTQNPSLASASNIFVISETNAKDLELKMGGKLSNYKIREKLFDNTYAMIIAVVDREWDRVTFYTRNIAAGTDVSIKEIKSANRGKGPDIMDIMKAFNMGSAPSF